MPVELPTTFETKNLLALPEFTLFTVTPAPPGSLATSMPDVGNGGGGQRSAMPEPHARLEALCVSCWHRGRLALRECPAAASPLLHTQPQPGPARLAIDPHGELVIVL